MRALTEWDGLRAAADRARDLEADTRQALRDRDPAADLAAVTP